jgi:hypothetical protein
MTRLNPRLLGLTLPFVAVCAGAQVPTDQLRFHFETSTVVSDDIGLLELGTLSAQGARGSRRDIVVLEQVTLRLDGGAGAPATTQLWVALGVNDPDISIRIDGFDVSTIPVLIDPVHRVGNNVAHEIVLSISPQRASGDVLLDLVWSAQTD